MHIFQHNKATIYSPGPAPRRTFRDRSPPIHCLRPSPKREFCPSERGLCPKESIRLGATGVQFEAWDSQNTGYYPRIRVQELFFRRFCFKDSFFCGLSQKSCKFERFLKWKPFFFRFSPQSSWNFAIKTFVYGPHFQIQSIKVFMLPQNLFMPPPVTLSWRRAWYSLKNCFLIQRVR